MLEWNRYEQRIEPFPDRTARRLCGRDGGRPAVVQDGCPPVAGRRPAFTPLSRAYPFVAIAFALTPLLGGLVFAEPLSARLLIGLAVIVGGLYLVAG